MKLGVCYYPEQWPQSVWRDDARRMAAMGIRVVRIAEFAWSRMEPRPGEYDWAWLDEAIAVLSEAGLQVVLGTPTAAPPRWLLDRHPDIVALDAHGHPKGFGSRRHYCFSSPAFFEASRSIVTAMAARYGQHPAVIAWQTDNEYGCHDTVLSYSAAAVERFRGWLAARYGSIAALNEAWGNVFWSMEYASFEQINAPVGLPTFANPIHALDYRRFASDEVKRYNRMQVEILRTHAPGRDVLHNFMGFFGEFDHHELAQDLDVASWDNYPLGFTDTVRFLSDDERLRWMRSGHPDISAFNHDLYRGLCKGRWWVMEQQAGPVNWANANPAPLPGMVRTWTWEAFAHGAELVSYFRWRQVPYAQEQMHSGLHTPDGRIDVGGTEATQVARELARLQPGPARQARVALVFDYAAKWMHDIQPHGTDIDYYGEVFAWYSALRRLGLDIDIVPASRESFSGYALIAVPALTVIDEALVGRLRASGAQLVFGPRCGAKTADFAIPEGLPPGALRALLPMRVNRVETLRDGVSIAVQAAGQELGVAGRWRDFVEPLAQTEVQARFADGQPAILRHGRTRYFAGCFSPALLLDQLEASARDAGIGVQRVDDGLRLRRRGKLQFAINHGPHSARVPAPPDTQFVLGSEVLPPASVAAWEVAAPDDAA
ncbi:beta-galactosidase [Niveibacterium umoris]|uniref:Beta-galactosidase n=1 Tax=Niveibacterium umoris TaxID=1193620 RepID=A0A840BIT6_9RHOO|nr:beta-galactosidase [Niveibacterium umoris]MBB4013135.1 beta-galactosidase [Niveibacterium umoris]